MKKKITKIVLVAIATILSSNISAQDLKLNISDAQYTKPLLETLISAYQKQHPEFHATVVTTGTADGYINIASNDEGQNVIGSIAVLPIANSQSAILDNKKVKKGIDAKLAHKLFVKQSLDDQIDGAKAEELPGTVYSLTGSHSATTDIVAKSLNVKASDIKGKKILGNEENVLTVVKRHPDAISFNVASLVYDPSTRKPVNGVSVLNIDIDGNGRVTDDERQAFNSLDALTTYLGNASRNDIPTVSLTLSTSDNNLKNFASWIATSGENILSHYGYLKAGNSLTAQK